MAPILGNGSHTISDKSGNLLHGLDGTSMSKKNV
jgi:hypothetical protein